METSNLDSGRETMSSSSHILTREEYDALMAELAQEARPEFTVPTPKVAVKEKVRKLEFNMMVLVGLILVVFILCRTN